MYRIISIKHLMLLGGLFGVTQPSCASEGLALDQENYRFDDQGNYWRPCENGFNKLGLVEAERQQQLPLKKRVSLRPDYLHYDHETDTTWQRVYPNPDAYIEIM